MSSGYLNWVRNEIERLDAEWCWASESWGYVYELALLQMEGHITHLQCRYDKHGCMGHWVFRFKPTDTFHFGMLFNFPVDYLPDEWEERRKWYTW